MKKEALTAYLTNNTLDTSGVYGYYEFNTGRKQFLYNNYYSGEQNYVLLSVTGLKVVGGGVYYTTNDTGYIYSKYREHKDIPFKVTVDGGGAITSAYIDGGNTGGNVQGNVIGGVGTGLYYEIPDAYIISKDSRTEGDLYYPQVLTYVNYDYGTRYDLNPLVSFGVSTGVIRSALQVDLGSGHFSGRDCLRFSSGFNDLNWTMFIDLSISGGFAEGKSEVLLTSYDKWTNNKGFAVTIDDSFHLNFEYKSDDNQIQNYPLSIELQENNLLSISKDGENNILIFGRHNLTEEEHSFQKLEVVYSGNSNLFIGGFSGGIYTNTGYTGLSGRISEILFLNQSCNIDQLTKLSELFTITGYDAPKTGVESGYYSLVTGIDTEALVIASSGITGYDLVSGQFDGGTGYAPSGISGGIVETGTIIYYDPTQSGVYEDKVIIDEAFYFDSTLKNKYAEKFISFEEKLEATDILEIYSFNSYDTSQPNNFEVSFASVPGKVYLQTGLDNINFNLYENGVYQVSGKDYRYFDSSSLIDSTPYKPYSNSKVEEVFNCSIPNNVYQVSGFTFVPSAGSNYTYSNFPFSLDNNTGYFIYLNGQKLVSGSSFDYTISSNTLTINNATNNYDTGIIDIAGIRSGSSRNYVNAYGTYTPPLYVSGFSYRIIDEVIFLNGQRLKRNDDYYKTSTGKLNLRNANVSRQNSFFFSGDSGFFNV